MWLWLACGIETGVGSVEEPAAPLEISLTATPSQVDLGTVDKAGTSSVDLEIRNTGDTWLDIEFSTTGDAAFSTPQGPITLQPNESALQTVFFSPDHPFAHAGAFHATATGALGADVLLIGTGSSPHISMTVKNPDDAVINCAATSGSLIATNFGGHDLTLETADLIEGFPAFLLDATALPIVLSPGSSIELPLSFRPSTVGEQQGVWVVRSNDPTQPDAVASATGFGVFAGEPHVDSFVVEPRTVALLIAFDRSGSMTAELPIVQPAMERLIDEIGTVAAEWRIGVVTGISACFNEGILDANTEDLHATFVDAMLGEGSLLTEALLALAADAAEAPCNTGFWFPGEPLQVVVVSDEPEQSGDWQAQVDRIVAVVGDPWQVHISGVVDLNNLCGDGAEGYVEAAAETSGVLLDVCSPVLVDHILELLVPHAIGVDTFVLSEAPVESSIEVTVDGASWTNVYDAAIVGVRLVPEPPVGADVVISWQAALCPP